jgi:hypothetical protein
MGDRSIAPCYRDWCDGAVGVLIGCVVSIRNLIDSAPHCCDASWTRSQEPQITTTEKRGEPFQLREIVADSSQGDWQPAGQWPMRRPQGQRAAHTSAGAKGEMLAVITQTEHAQGAAEGSVALVVAKSTSTAALNHGLGLQLLVRCLPRQSW